MKDLLVTKGEVVHSHDYYFGNPQLASDAWPTIPPNIKSIQVDHKLQYVEFSEVDFENIYPGPYAIPDELLKFTPTKNNIFREFFKHQTGKKSPIRQIFFHVELTELEKQKIEELYDYFRWKNFPIRKCVEPFIFRILLFCWRKTGNKSCLPKTYEHILELINWRATFLPVLTIEPVIQYNIKYGAVYWTARDENMQPLLVIRVKRLFHEKLTPNDFKRLVVYNFEWALRFLFVPGLVETCSVILDVRGASLHSLPISNFSDITATLTKQYPFRLDKMYIINDSIFIQAAWNIVKQFLTEIQQQKMIFMRSNYGSTLMKIYAAHHLEVDYGGTRPMISQFDPPPLLPGPFEPNSKGPKSNAIPDCHKAIDVETTKGVMWIRNIREPIKWSKEAPEIFEKCGTPFNIKKPLKSTSKGENAKLPETPKEIKPKNKATEPIKNDTPSIKDAVSTKSITPKNEEFCKSSEEESDTQTIENTCSFNIKRKSTVNLLSVLEKSENIPVKSIQTENLLEKDTVMDYERNLLYSNKKSSCRFCFCTLRFFK